MTLKWKRLVAIVIDQVSAGTRKHLSKYTATIISTKKNQPKTINRETAEKNESSALNKREEIFDDEEKRASEEVNEEGKISQVNEEGRK